MTRSEDSGSPGVSAGHPACQARMAKRRQILAGARAVFGDTCFDRTSVDELAARAGVSKATVYKHFRDKQALYAACLSEEADGLRESVACMLSSSEPTGDIEVALQQAGERLLTLALNPAIVRFYRNVSVEVERFPELGQMLFAKGPAMMIAVIGDYLWRWHEQGALHIDDRNVAALQFVMLCHGDLVVRSQLGVLPDPLHPAIVETVRRAVATFLLAYGRSAQRP